LKPLTMNEIAMKADVHHTTVSRTVNGKYAKTPFGTVELRSFFIAGIAKADGEEVRKDKVLERLSSIVEEEDKTAPLSDEAISAQLREEGFVIARRTVAKYRSMLSIPGAADRLKTS